MGSELLTEECEKSVAADPESDVLAQTTRRRIFDLFAELGGSATTEELAVRLEMHPNGVRSHLVRMLDAGVVVRRRTGQGRGRPRDWWAVSPDADGSPEPYRLLARWLARTFPASPARLRDVERMGREIGSELATGAAVPAEQAIEDMLAALGFRPAVERRPGALSCRLRTCPYRDSVRENRDVVCALHRGLTRGVLDRAAPAARLRRFVPHDPDEAGCEIEIDGLVRA